AMNVFPSRYALAFLLSMGSWNVTAHAETDPTATYRDIAQTFGFLPEFMQSFPKEGIQGAWTGMKGILISTSEIPTVEKNLIALAVASQIPCRHCSFYHLRSANALGADEAKTNEAVGLSAAARHWVSLFTSTETDPALLANELTVISAYMSQPAQPL